MNIFAMLAELREEKGRIDAAIVALERYLRRRAARPSEWLPEIDVADAGRPRRPRMHKARSPQHLPPDRETPGTDR